MDVLPLVGVLLLVGVLTGLAAAAGKPMCQWLTFTFENSCAYTSPGHAGMKENARADRPVGKATLTSGLLLGRSEALRSLRHHLPAQSQGRHNVVCLEERGKRKSLTIFLERRREGYRQSDEHWNCLKGNVGKNL